MLCLSTLCRDRDAFAASSHDLSRCVRRFREHYFSTPVVVGRYYDPQTGQFLSVDPMVEQTRQAYLYSGDDPVNGIDPSGLVPSCQWWNIVCQVAALADSMSQGAWGWLQGDSAQQSCSGIGWQAATLCGVGSFLATGMTMLGGDGDAAGEEEILTRRIAGDGMIGERGIQVPSLEVGRGEGWRIDIENPAPGRRPGQMHLQDYSGHKYFFNFRTGNFEGLSVRQMKQFSRSANFRRAILKGLSHLGY